MVSSPCLWQHPILSEHLFFFVSVHSPNVVDECVIEIEEGRHPIVDQLQSDGTQYVPNDTKLSVRTSIFVCG